MTRPEVEEFIRLTSNVYSPWGMADHDALELCRYILHLETEAKRKDAALRLASEALVSTAHDSAWHHAVVAVRSALTPATETQAAEIDDDACRCESCGKVIKEGDRYAHTLDGCYLCEEDAPTYRDCLEYWAHHAPDDDDEREAASDCQKAFNDHIAAGGSPEDKPLSVMSP